MADDEHQGGERDTAKLVVVALLAIILVAFIVVNTEEVDVDFIVTDISIPLIFVLAGTAILGALIDRLLTARRHRRQR